MMNYYPINLDIRRQNCLVVGGGAVGTRKVMTLIACGAKVTVISPELTEELQALSEKGAITWISRPYTTSDLSDAFLVIGATNDKSLNHRIHRDALNLNKLCNIADQPESCNFILPSIVNRGDLVLTVSTSGKSPAYAKKVKQFLEGCFGEENAIFLRLMGAIRKLILRMNTDAESNRELFEKLVNSGIVDLIRDNRINQINEKLREILGDGYDFNTLVQAEDESKPGA